METSTSDEKYKVLEDFIPERQSDELKIKAGEFLNVLYKDICGWWFGQNENGDSGWVPANYLEEKAADRNNEELDAERLGKNFISLEAWVVKIKDISLIIMVSR